MSHRYASCLEDAATSSVHLEPQSQPLTHYRPCRWKQSCVCLFFFFLVCACVVGRGGYAALDARGDTEKVRLATTQESGETSSEGPDNGEAVTSQKVHSYTHEKQHDPTLSPSPPACLSDAPPTAPAWMNKRRLCLGLVNTRLINYGLPR